MSVLTDAFPSLARNRSSKTKKQWCCPVADCPCGYGRQCDLKNHFILRHPDRLDDFPDLRPTKVFACTVPKCGAKFARLQVLHRHTAKVHSDSVPTSMTDNSFGSGNDSESGNSFDEDDDDYKTSTTKIRQTFVVEGEGRRISKPPVTVAEPAPVAVPVPPQTAPKPTSPSSFSPVKSEDSSKKFGLPFLVKTEPQIHVTDTVNSCSPVSSPEPNKPFSAWFSLKKQEVIQVNNSVTVDVAQNFQPPIYF